MINLDDLSAKKIAPPFVPNCGNANCELDDEDIQGGLLGGGDGRSMIEEQRITEEENAKFQGYEWNTRVADLVEGKRETVAAGSLLTMAEAEETKSQA